MVKIFGKGYLLITWSKNPDEFVVFWFSENSETTRKEDVVLGCQPFMDQARHRRRFKVDFVETELKTHGDVPGQSFDPSSSISSISSIFSIFSVLFGGIFFLLWSISKLGKNTQIIFLNSGNFFSFKWENFFSNRSNRTK